MKKIVAILMASFLGSGAVLASHSAPASNDMILVAKHSGGPPGLAKKGGLPPGLAKQFGPTLPGVAYVAVDPRYDDRAWFLINGGWVLRQGFDSALRVEVRSLMALPPIPAPPPVPLPSVAVSFHVVAFQ
jgi:hypothetical protein